PHPASRFPSTALFRSLPFLGEAFRFRCCVHGTLSRERGVTGNGGCGDQSGDVQPDWADQSGVHADPNPFAAMISRRSKPPPAMRSEEHTSELQSRENL